MRICIHWYQVPAEFQHDRVHTELAGWFSMIIVPRIFIYKPAFNLRIYMVPLPSMTLMMRTERTSPVSGFLRCKIFSQEWDRPPPQVAMPFFFEMFSSFSISVPPELNTLSADSFAFILVYGFVLVALVIYVGIRLARRRWATLWWWWWWWSWPRWRSRQAPGGQSQAISLNSSTSGLSVNMLPGSLDFTSARQQALELPPCGHPGCRQTPQVAANCSPDWKLVSGSALS